MKTFYLFKINKNYRNIAKKTPNNIYILLNSIYRYNKKDILIAFDLFEEICIPINYNFINEYIFKKLVIFDEYTKFKNIHMYNNYFTDEVSKMEIFKSYIKIKSNINNNIFILNMLELENIFICDFNSNYFKYSSNKEKVKIKKQENLVKNSII